MVNKLIIETERKIKTRELKLSEMSFILPELKAENGNNNSFFDFLSDDLTELLKEKLTAKKWKFYDLNLGYSLSYSQGDGFNFKGFIRTDKALFKISSSNCHYEHERATNIELIEFKLKKGFIYFEELTAKEQEKAERILNDFKEEYYILCKEMAKIGYSIIEETEKENILKNGFNDFLSQNNISQDEQELFNFDYATEQKKGYVKIADKGDTYLKGLFIKDFKVKKTYKSIVYKPLIEEITEII